MKTLAFFSVLLDQGCRFKIDSDSSDVCVDVTEGFDGDTESDSDEESDVTEGAVFSSCSRHLSRVANCKGRVSLRGNRFGRSYVQ